MDTEKSLSQLVQRLLKTHSRNLLSVVLYGSAAAGDYQHKHSDLNVLCVLRELNVDELEKVEQTAHWWRAQGNPAPLVLSEREVTRSADAFPVEFVDMLERHRVLHGDDPVAALEIDPLYHRVQVEHELRAKLLALRQRYLGIHRDRKAVVHLLVDALPAFATLFRHALMLAGERPPLRKREVVAAAAQRFGFDPAGFVAALDVREAKRRPSSVEARSSFESYYTAVVTVCEAVDRLDGKAESQ